jgi:hypothetical protein
MLPVKTSKWLDTLCSKVKLLISVAALVLILGWSPVLAQDEVEDPRKDDEEVLDGGGPEETLDLEAVKMALEAHRQKAKAAAEAAGKLVAGEIKLTPQWNEAIMMATADLQTMRQSASISGQQANTSSFRFVWIPDGNPEDLALTSFVVNSVISRNDINFAPNRRRSPIQYLANNQLVRVDLLALCPRGQDFDEVAGVWDSMFNPYLLLEEGATEEEVTEILRVKVKVAPYLAEGKRYDFKWEEQEVTRTVRVAGRRVVGPHVDIRIASALVGMTASINPIVRCDTLYQNALTTTDGGLYYAFIGADRASLAQRKEGLSDFDLFLKRMDLSQTILDRQRSDQRVAMTKSGISGKPRRIDFFNRSSRVSSGLGLIAITQDMLDSDNNAGADPFLNLLEFKTGGSEVIYKRNNGHLAYLLFDGKGNMVDEAPPNLVMDHHIPDPYTKRLQPAIGCIRCHAKGESGGWHPVENHVKLAMSSLLNAYDSAEGIKQKLDIPETLAKMARLYDGNLDVVLRRAREDHSDTMVVTVGDMVNKEGLPWQFKDVGKALEDRFIAYKYTSITPLTACKELGYLLKDEETATLLLNRLLGRLPRAVEFSIHREDMRIALLKLNIPINRFQWELVYIDAALRSIANTPAALAMPLPKKQPDEGQ